MQKRLFMLVVTLLTLSLTVVAQVTTSGINGIVTANNEEVIGATVSAKHVPSGSVYRAVTNMNGRYTITGMRSGGAYEVEVSYIGYQTKKFTGIQLSLGQNTVVDVVLTEGSEMLQEVEIVASARNTMRSDRSGAVTNVNGEQMAAVPTVGRSMTDIMKLTPQSSSASGMAIGGGNYRQSSITVDGAAFNNAFGLGSSPLPGGGTPISLDALDQMTISITPYDVRQSGFTGGGINAVTKSGTNEFKGSLYTYITSTSLKGSRVANTAFEVDDGHNDTYGLTFGGPIIKDKLFFFVNGEVEDNLTAGPVARAGDGSVPYTNTKRRPQLEELESLSTYLQNSYGLTTGPWQGYNVKTPAFRILARVDWNINDNHKFNVRFTKSNRKSSSAASASRTVGDSKANAIYGGSQNTYGINSNYGMSSLSSRYYAEYKFTSIAGELNSRFGKVNNTLRATYSFQDQPRSTEYNDAAPVVEILMNDGQDHFPTWACTGDIFTYGNLSQTKTTVITDEVNVTLGKHNLFGGIQYEHNYAANGYAQAAAGYYTYEATPEEVAAGDWATVFGRAPRTFAITAGNNPNFNMFTSEMKTNQWSFYVQDNISWSERFRMSVGFRFELPSYPSLANNYNEKFNSLDFGGRHFRTDNVPGASLSFSPRIGFNWDINGSRKYILRGGTGLFVGRMPFVWLVSAVGNSGVGQTSYFKQGTNVPFTMNQKEMLNSIGATGEVMIPTGPTILSDDLRMPKTWKASLAFDAKLPGDIDFTVEGIYNWDLNPVVVSNANLHSDGTIDLGHGDVRQKTSTYVKQKDYPEYAGKWASIYDPAVYILENAGTKAHYASLSFQLHKAFDFGLDLNASYTLQTAKSYTEGIGDQVSSAYNNYRNSVNAVNDNETGYATYVAPNRFLFSASYKLKESKNVTNTFSLLYDAYQYAYLGNYSYSRYSYIFTKNVTGDSNGPGNLIYVPASRQELNNWDFAEGKVNGEVYTADMQRDDFWAFIQQDDYLKNRTGQYAERGGAKMPWHHQLDFKYLRSMSLNWGKTKHTLQLGLDIENLLNFLCKDWGLYKQITGNDLLSYDTKTNKYQYNLVNGARHLYTSQNYENLASTYRIQFTIRYLFN